MPLVDAGQVVRDFWMRFEAGRVVEYGAEQGREVLARYIIEADENSCRLGEVALVSKNTPIRQSETLFFDTLYDENASCRTSRWAWASRVPRGRHEPGLRRAPPAPSGVNQSSTHVDSSRWAPTTSTSTALLPPMAPRPRCSLNGEWAWE